MGTLLQNYILPFVAYIHMCGSPGLKQPIAYVVFEVMYYRTFINGIAHVHGVDTSGIH